MLAGLTPPQSTSLSSKIIVRRRLADRAFASEARLGEKQRGGLRAQQELAAFLQIGITAFTS